MLTRMRAVVAVVSALALSGCSISTPFRGSGYDTDRGVILDGGDTVYVSITHAVLAKDRRLRSTFWTHVRRVEASLQQRPGFVAYSMRRQLFGNEAWTMTVWADESSVKAFINSDAHQRAIGSAAAALTAAHFARVELQREELPLSWERALELLHVNNAGYRQP